MSYCRFSSDNWRSDVYVYEDVGGGWTTHVAGRRRAIGPIPDLPIMSLPGFGGEWDRESRKMVYPTRWRAAAAWVVWGFAAWWTNWVHMGSLRLIPLRKITLPHAGETFNHATPGECADHLDYLGSLGYWVPQYAMRGLYAEQDDMNEEQSK